MFIEKTPEEIGLDSRYVRRFLGRLREKNVNLHSVLMGRGDALFLEKYTAPFTRETPHRMYSVTKSFAGLAIGFLADEGRLSLDDRITDYFPAPPEADPLLYTQTIRDMLTMRTCFAGAASCQPEAMQDRVGFYMRQKASKYPGTLFDYDSAGSHLLGILAENLSGKPLLEYLKEKLLDRLGDFEDAQMLTTPDGHAWASSALICRPRGLAKVVRFLLDGGVWEGERLLSEDYVRAATSCQTNNDLEGAVRYNRCGYGYQIWQAPRGAFSFNGAYSQFALGLPEKDLFFVCTGDTQMYTPDDQPRLFDALYEEIIDRLDGGGTAPDADPGAPWTLPVAFGAPDSPLRAAIDGKTYVMRPNPMGIERFSLSWEDGQGIFRWRTVQGDKELAFGMKENVFGLFPQYGYSDDVGFRHDLTDFRYRCCASAGWLDERMLQLKVHIVDRYFGALVVTFGFRDADRVSVRMIKNAQDFLDEYTGWMLGEAPPQGG